jgi:multicomponent Na+:H+ antiporter subunit D
VLLVMCAVTIIAGSFLALGQNNLKKRLAYSTVVHLSYIVLGAALLSPLGMTGSVFHLANHGLAKITLFFCAGAIYSTAHLENISDLKGLGWKMPWTFGAFTIGSLALVGIPGLCGFVSKFFLCRGALQAHDYAAFSVLLGASVLTGAYLLPIVRTAFFDKADAPDAAHGHGTKAHDSLAHAHEDHGEARSAILVPILICATLVIIFGILPAAINAQYDLATGVARQVFGVAP